MELFKSALVELQSNCNRSCFFCPRYGDRSGKRLDVQGVHTKKEMPTDKAIKILNDLKDMGFTGPVGFHHMSEPFLDSRVFDFAKLANELGMQPYAHTNGDVLKAKPELVASVRLHFHKIVVELYDCSTPTEFDEEEAYWTDTLKGVQVAFSRVDHVYPRTLTPYDDRMFREKQEYKTGICRRPTLRLIIHYTGNMALCCEDLPETFSLGNAFTTPVSELWGSPRHRSVIADLDRGDRTAYDLCSRCALPPQKV